MASIQQIVQRTVNPFDSTSFRPGNFWHDDSSQATSINGIHEEIVAGVSQMLSQVQGDRRSRTVVLSGGFRFREKLSPGPFKTNSQPSSLFCLYWSLARK